MVHLLDDDRSYLAEKPGHRLVPLWGRFMALLPPTLVLARSLGACELSVIGIEIARGNKAPGGFESSGTLAHFMRYLLRCTRIKAQDI